MADPFRNELEGAMARADRAEHEAARLRQELAAAKAPPATPTAPTLTPPASSAALALGAGLVLLAAGAGAGAYFLKAGPAEPPVVVVASAPAPAWSRDAAAIELAALAAHEGVTIADFECAPIVAAHDPTAFMCRAHATAEQRDKLTNAFGMVVLHPIIDSPPNGCSVLRPYMAPKAIERFGHVGAAAVPKPSETMIKLLYVSPATNDVCFEIDYAGK
jgi:hypothetical protein